MLLAAGVKGGRLAWPNSSIVLQPPVLNGERAHVPNLMRHAHELRLHASKQAHYIGIFTGRGQKEVFVDCGRNKHLNPREVRSAATWSPCNVRLTHTGILATLSAAVMLMLCFWVM